MPRRRPLTALVAVLVLAGVTAGCDLASTAPTGVRSSRLSPQFTPFSVTRTPTAPAATARATTPRPTTARPSTPRDSPPRSSTVPPPVAPPSTQPAVPSRAPAGTGPVIVIDPGHSPAVTATDPATGLTVSDYENEPEMQDVFAVATLVRASLLAAGYRVVMTKTTARQTESLGARAALANQVHAALALSIHDQAGPNGGIGFDAGNNTVYYQSVGDYRATASGHRVYFTDAAVAAVSRRFGQIFQAERSAVEHHAVALRGDVGYDLGSRGLPAGDIWMVQLLADVPWIYNEAGGNSPGMSGLDVADERRYAAGLVVAVEHCVPLH